MMWFESIFFWSITTFVMSLVFTSYLIKFSKKNNLLDVPVDRSSHSIPTPKIGGVVIVLSSLCFMISTIFIHNEENTGFEILGLLMLCLGLVAFIDDLKGLNIVIRGISYLLFSTVFVFFYSDFVVLDLIELVSLFVIVVAMMWVINLYNFMDGADGLAAIQALIALLPTGVIFFLSGKVELAFLCFVISASTAGFLFWNWPPAKIFMGDVGSCVLGFVIGALAYISYTLDIIPIHIWLILMSVFIVDSTLTLLMRILSGEKWYMAHSSHAYQRYLQMGHNHKQLVSNFLIFDIIVLLPAAWIAYKYPDYKLHMLIIVYIFVSMLWFYMQWLYKRYIGA